MSKNRARTLRFLKGAQQCSIPLLACLWRRSDKVCHADCIASFEVLLGPRIQGLLAAGGLRTRRIQHWHRKHSRCRQVQRLSAPADLAHKQSSHSSGSAFAALLADESIVTWGDDDDGGDSSAGQAQLKDVRQIQSTKCAFAASLIRWICRHLG